MLFKRPVIESYIVIDSLPKLKKLRKKMLKIQEFAYDTETNTKDFVRGPNEIFRIVGISISWGSNNNYYIPLGHRRVEDVHRQLPIETVVNYLKEPFEREDVRIIAHNLKFDMHVLARIGIEIKTKDIIDTMILSWLCDENTRNGLKVLSSDVLKVQQEHFNEVTETVTKEIKKEFGLTGNQKATFDLVLICNGASYALYDAYYTYMLYMYFIDEIHKEKMWAIYKKVYIPFTYALYNMEERGVTIDLDQLHNMEIEMQKDLEDYEYKILELAGVEFSPTSNQQLAELLFGYEKLDKDGNVSKNINQNIIKKNFGFKPTSFTKKGAPSTDNDTLYKLSCVTVKGNTQKAKRKAQGVMMCKLLCDYKKLQKLKTAFVDGLLEQVHSDGKVHPSFNIIGTDSGRLSCSSPNLQQLPKAKDSDKYQIRNLFIGSIDPVTNQRKKIIAIDYANLEMRVLAHFSEDKNLLEMFATGVDTHGSTAVNMFELDCSANDAKKLYPHLRQASKTLNFLLMYGGGAFNLYTKLKDDRESPIDLGDEKYLETYGVKKGVDVAQIYIDKYFNTYKGVTSFINNQHKMAHRLKYVNTLLGRKRRLPDINSSDGTVRSYCERLSVNSAVQGSAADITMSAQNRIDNDPWFAEHRCLMIIQVHDELVFECPAEYVEEAISRIQRLMEFPFGDNVKLNLDLRADADSGDSYQEAK